MQVPSAKIGENRRSFGLTRRGRVCRAVCLTFTNRRDSLVRRRRIHTKKQLFFVVVWNSRNCVWLNRRQHRKMCVRVTLSLVQCTRFYFILFFTFSRHFAQTFLWKCGHVHVVASRNLTNDSDKTPQTMCVEMSFILIVIAEFHDL